MITCSLLWLIKYGHVTFSKFSLAGFDVIFNNPDSLILSIWIAFGYFLYRYYQYFSSEGVTSLKKVFTALLEEKCEPKIRSLVIAVHPDSDAAPFSYVSLKSSNWVYRGKDPIYNNNRVIVSSKAFELPISRWKLKKGIAVSVIDFVFRNSVVTDYILPFIFAGWILWYCGANDWNGSFLRLILSD